MCVVCTLATVKAIHNATKETNVKEEEEAAAAAERKKQPNHRQQQQQQNMYRKSSIEYNRRQLHMLIASIKLCMCQEYTSYIHAGR